MKFRFFFPEPATVSVTPHCLLAAFKNKMPIIHHTLLYIETHVCILSPQNICVSWDMKRNLTIVETSCPVVQFCSATMSAVVSTADERRHSSPMNRYDAEQRRLGGFPEFADPWNPAHRMHDQLRQLWSKPIDV